MGHLLFMKVRKLIEGTWLSSNCIAVSISVANDRHRYLGVDNLKPKSMFRGLY